MKNKKYHDNELEELNNELKNLFEEKNVIVNNKESK